MLIKGIHQIPSSLMPINNWSSIYNRVVHSCSKPHSAFLPRTEEDWRHEPIGNLVEGCSSFCSLYNNYIECYYTLSLFVTHHYSPSVITMYIYFGN